jgi:hypothetical protein
MHSTAWRILVNRNASLLRLSERLVSVADFTVGHNLTALPGLVHSKQRPTQREQCLLADSLLHPPTDLVQQVVLLAIDFPAGLIEGAPRLVALRLDRPRLALSRQLLGQVWSQPRGLLRRLQRFIQFLERRFARPLLRKCRKLCPQMFVRCFLP